MYKEIPVKEYDEKLPEFFKKEKERINKNLDGKFEIHHIGSSAVQDLGGKNWIDILLLVKDKKTAEKMIKRVEDLGYNYRENASTEHRKFFKKIHKYFGEEKRFHLHLMWKTEDNYKDALLFRNYLRKHPDEADRYFELKKKWARQAENSDEYTELKTDYVKEIVDRAREEGYL